MSDNEEAKIDIDHEKAATEPLTGGESPTKVTFTPSSPDGKKAAKIELDASLGAVKQSLTKEELMVYANDPTWSRIRNGLFYLFWVTWIGIFVAAVVITATATRCPLKVDSNSTIATTVDTLNSAAALVAETLSTSNY